MLLHYFTLLPYVDYFRLFTTLRWITLDFYHQPLADFVDQDQITDSHNTLEIGKVRGQSYHFTKIREQNTENIPTLLCLRF